MYHNKGTDWKYLHAMSFEPFMKHKMADQNPAKKELLKCDIIFFGSNRSCRYD